MVNDIAIQTRRLKKVFDGREVIQKCDMTVQKGSIYGLLGVNGAGKTTIFKMLMGLLQPSGGCIEMFGRDIAENKDGILRNIGSMIEVPVFYEHLSAAENLDLHLSYMGASKSEIGKVLELVGLDRSSNQPVSQYSLGMRQRLGIARALSHKPKVLLLDEPINGLDPFGIREMRELFLDLSKQSQITILISSHILNEIAQIADTIGVLTDGILANEVSMSDIKERFDDGLEDYFFQLIKGGNGVDEFNEVGI